jgi:hypothetical protein
MLEIKLCATCARYQCTEHAGQVTLDQRACSDCEEWTALATMTRTPAGNVICPRCVKRRRNLAAQRAQLSLLDQQPLF